MRGFRELRLEHVLGSQATLREFLVKSPVRGSAPRSRRSLAELRSGGGRRARTAESPRTRGRRRQRSCCRVRDLWRLVRGVAVKARHSRGAPRFAHGVTSHQRVAEERPHVEHFCLAFLVLQAHEAHLRISLLSDVDASVPDGGRESLARAVAPRRDDRDRSRSSRTTAWATLRRVAGRRGSPPAAPAAWEYGRTPGIALADSGADFAPRRRSVPPNATVSGTGMQAPWSGACREGKPPRALEPRMRSPTATAPLHAVFVAKRGDPRRLREPRARQLPRRRGRARARPATVPPSKRARKGAATRNVPLRRAFELELEGHSVLPLFSGTEAQPCRRCHLRDLRRSQVLEPVRGLDARDAAHGQRGSRGAPRLPNGVPRPQDLRAHRPGGDHRLRFLAPHALELARNKAAVRGAGSIEYRVEEDGLNGIEAPPVHARGRAAPHPQGRRAPRTFQAGAPAALSRRVRR